MRTAPLLGFLKRSGENYQQIENREVPTGADGSIAIIINQRRGKDMAELFAQPAFHLQFIRVDAVFGQAAGLDIAVEQHHPHTVIGQLMGRV